jgi:hypothetical protein
MRIHRAGAAVVLLAASLGANALNRCADASGKVTYSDKPCAGSEQRSRVTVHDSAGFNPERAPRTDVRAQQLGTLPHRGRSQAVAAVPGAVHMGRTQEQLACDAAKRDYEHAASTRVGRPSSMQLAQMRRTTDIACGLPTADSAARISALTEQEQLAAAQRRLRAAQEALEPRKQANPRTSVTCNAGACSDFAGKPFYPVIGLQGVLESHDGRRCTIRPLTNVCD